MIRTVMIQDDTLPGERAALFSEAKLRANIKLPWSAYSRGNLDFTTLKSMKESGCRNLHVGFETADNAILKVIRKGLTRERLTKFSHDSKRAGVRIHGDFAIGFPGETPRTIQNTIDWACEIRPHTAQFQLMIPFPGTPFHQLLLERNWLKDNAPDYPEVSWSEMEMYAKKAYRQFYLSLPYLFEVMKHPYELGFAKINTYMSAIPSIFWKKWQVR